MTKSIFILAACFSLAACGGGGGGSSSGDSSGSATDPLVGAAVSLSTSNYEPASTEIVASALDIQDSGQAPVQLLTGAQVTPMITPTMFLQAKLPQLSQALSRKAQLTGAIVEDSVPCDQGGSIGLAHDDQNNNELLDTGDRVEFTLNGCKFDDWTFSGKMIMKLNRGSADSDLLARDINVLATAQNFKAEFNAIQSVSNGSFTLDITSAGANTLTVDIQSPNLTNQLTQAGKTKVFQYRDYRVTSTIGPVTASWSVKGKVNVPALGANTATLETLSAFSGPLDQFATSGQLLITVSNGGKMRVSASGTNNLKVELDLNSDGTYEESKPVPWIDVL